MTTAPTTPTPTHTTCTKCFPRPCHDPSHAFRRPLSDLEWKRLQAWDRASEAQEASNMGLNLGPWETTVEKRHTDNLGQKHRFARCTLERQNWLEILPRIEPDERRVNRFEQCGSTTYILRHLDTRELRTHTNACKLRICPVCRRARQARAMRLLHNALQDAKPREWQMITLTLKHNSDPLQDRLRFLRSCFRRLRHRQCWMNAVSHGYAVLEINWSNATGSWHPHLHILARCSFIDWSQLRSDWLKITKGSHHVNSKIVTHPHGACCYLVKYLGKAPDETVMTRPELAAEYYQAIDRARMLLPFGNAPPPPEKPKSLYCRADWEQVGNLVEFIIRSKRGDDEATQLLNALAESRKEREQFFHRLNQHHHYIGTRSQPRSPP